MPRKSDFLKPKKTMLIVVEGETELIYFNQLRADYYLPNLSIEPKVSPRKDPQSIIKRAELENLRKGFDYTWCVFDLDTKYSNLSRFDYAKRKAKRLKYFLAESFPCFEIWFLLHFVYTTKQFENCTQLVKELRVFINDYCKEQQYLIKKNLYNYLKEKISFAISNCEKIEAYNQSTDISDGTKCDIYKIIQKIDELKE